MRSVILLVLIAMIYCVAQSLSADDGAEKVRQARLQEMRRRAEELKLEAGEVSIRPMKLHGEPLLRFDDPTRAFADGTLWAWVERGRPHALVSVERYEKVWAYELISLTTEPLSLKTPLGQTWQPSEAPFTEKSLPEAKLGASANARRQQARQLARDFEMAEYVGPDDSRTVLRLIPRPIYEYADEKSGLLHGSMFVFANGTNPEVLLLVEATKSDDAGGWQFGCAPLSTARLEAKLGDRVQWESAKLVKYDFRRPYVAFGMPLAEEEK
jgi:hypothetical protein